MAWWVRTPAPMSGMQLSDATVVQDNLWLNEAFATLVGEVILVDIIEPSWKVQSSFISEHLAQALNLDSLRSSHPIEVGFDSPVGNQAAADALNRCLAPTRTLFSRSLTPYPTRREPPS